VLIKEFPGAGIIAVENNTITVEMKTPLAQLAELNKRLVQNGIKVVTFCEEKTDLEDLFMKISSPEQ
jgi:hypothetical protein